MKTNVQKTQSPDTTTSDKALDRLVNREEVLQICFWLNGEGFGDVYSATTIAPFLNCEVEAIEKALEDLLVDGHLQQASGSQLGYKFSEKGKKQGGRLFADTFSEYTRQGHGECPAGCCDGDDHSQCGDDCTLH